MSTATWRWSRRCARSRKRRASRVAQIAIAWVAAQGDDIVPLIGARRRDRLAEALGALEVTLDAADLAAIEQAVPKGRGGRRRATRLTQMASARQRTAEQGIAGDGRILLRRRQSFATISQLGVCGGQRGELC